MNVSFTGVPNNGNNVVELLSSDEEEQHKKNNNGVNQNSNSRSTSFIGEKQKLNLPANFKKNGNSIDYRQNVEKSKQKFFDKLKNSPMFGKPAFSSLKPSASDQLANSASVINLDSDN